MPRIVSAITSPISTPIMAAPFSITDRFTPAAKRASFHFFFTEEASMSRTLREGRISAEAFTRPVSSSMVKRTFSMRCTGSTSVQMPHPWLTTARMYSSGKPASCRMAGLFLQCSSGNSS